MIETLRAPQGIKIFFSSKAKQCVYKYCSLNEKSELAIGPESLKKFNLQRTKNKKQKKQQKNNYIWLEKVKLATCRRTNGDHRSGYLTHRQSRVAASSLC
jgi:hypothetical protein